MRPYQTAHFADQANVTLDGYYRSQYQNLRSHDPSVRLNSNVEPPTGSQSLPQQVHNHDRSTRPLTG